MASITVENGFQLIIEDSGGDYDYWAPGETWTGDFDRNHYYLYRSYIVNAEYHIEWIMPEDDFVPVWRYEWSGTDEKIPFSENVKSSIGGVNVYEVGLAGFSNSIVPSLPNSVEILSLGLSSFTSLGTLPSNLRELTIGDNNIITILPELPPTIEKFSISFCPNLKTITNIPSSVENLSFGFSNNDSLETVPPIPSSVNNMESCFQGCLSLEGIIIVNATNLSFYEDCFKWTVKPIILKGSNNQKQQLANTSTYGNVIVGDSPSCDYTPLTNSTGGIWVKSISVASTTITNATAVGTTVDNVRLSIGSASASIPANGVINLRVNDVGTFVPRITITDGYGDSRTYTLDPITIQDYSKPTITDISVERVIAPISQDDTQAKITCTIGHRYQISGNKLGVPEVLVNGNDISDEISWYDDAQKQVPYSGNYTGPPKTIYGWVDEIREIFHQTDTYTFTLSIADGYTESDSKTEVLPSIFTTMNFQRGGKEIAFGAKADDDVTEYENGLFKCGMSLLEVPMIGEVKMWAGQNIPIGWLLCDGSEVKKTDYPYLYEAIGDIWGVASDSNYFVLPIVDSAAPIGAAPDKWAFIALEGTTFTIRTPSTVRWGSGSSWYQKTLQPGTYTANTTTFDGQDPASGVVKQVEVKLEVGSVFGDDSHTLVVNEMPSHGHTQGSHRHAMGGNYSDGSGSSSAYVYSSNRKLQTRYTDYQTPVINASGGSKPHTNMQPSAVMNFIIRAY